MKSKSEFLGKVARYLGLRLKTTHITARVDTITYEALREMIKQLGFSNVSEAIRVSIWFTLIMLDPNLTINKAFKEEALERVKNGEDLPVIDCLKPFSEILKDKIMMFEKTGVDND